MLEGAFAGLRISIVSLLLLSACAKVADPLPPVVHPPATTQDLRVELRGDTARVYFPLPTPDIEWVEVFRHCNVQAPVSRFTMIARIASNELMPSENANIFVFSDQTSEDKRQCRYAVRFVDRKGQNSDFSNAAVAGTAPSR